MEFKMDFTAKVLLICVAIFLALVMQLSSDITKTLPRPEVNVDQYWGSQGSGRHAKDDASVKKFTIKTPDSVITHLKERLNESVEYQPSMNGAAFEYGFNSRTLKVVAQYWLDEYLPQWHKREQRINELPHFITKIQGLQIHFIHTKQKATADQKSVPVLLLHGWPGSVLEHYEMTRLLKTASNDKGLVFDVVVPSLPGFGWSTGSSKPGLGVPEIAVVLRNLMLRLGYDRFYVHGDDWGSAVGSAIATLFPENVKGYHSTDCAVYTPYALMKLLIASVAPKFFVEPNTKEFFFPLGEVFRRALRESGYMHIQATKPDTIGIALTENPLGLAAYILEKYSTWTNDSYRHLQDGGLEKNFCLDTLIDNVMVYYVTNSITTSMRIYAEFFASSYSLDRVETYVPTGCAHFKNDVVHFMDWQLKDKFVKLIQSTYYTEGGHFAVLQSPEIVFKDFMKFVNKVEK